MRFSRALLITLSLLISGSFALALSTPFKNFSDLSRAIGMGAYSQARASGTLKIAVLDNGFRDYSKELGKTLPSKTVFHAGPVAVDPKAEEAHGLFMAQLLAGLLGQAPGVSYELHLFSAFGYSNFEAAVNQVVQEHFDIVLYAQVWEYGGNGDGRGFINHLVNKATSAGVVWVNAAGNFGTGTFQSAVDVGGDDWAKLPGPNDSVRVQCKKSSKGKCGLRAVLSWNDFSDDVNTGTDKDLDLILADDTLKIVASSALTQMKSIPEGFPGGSLYPREIITQEVPVGTYLLRVKARSKNFDKKRDRLRLTISGDFVELVDQSGASESLLPPADNASVLTIGANDSERDSASARLHKPELLTISKVVLSNGEEYRGSSNSSAVAAAAVAVMKALHPNDTTADLIRRLGGAGSGSGSGSGSSDDSYFHGDEGRGLDLRALDLAPTGPGCFKQTNLPFVPRPLQNLLSHGGVPVETSRGLKIFLPDDPSRLLNVLRVSPDDMIVASNEGFEALPRSNQEFLPFGSYEVLQQPRGQIVCPLIMGNPGGGRPAPGSTLRLPKP